MEGTKELIGDGCTAAAAAVPAAPCVHSFSFVASIICLLRISVLLLPIPPLHFRWALTACQSQWVDWRAITTVIASELITASQQTLFPLHGPTSMPSQSGPQLSNLYRKMSLIETEWFCLLNDSQSLKMHHPSDNMSEPPNLFVEDAPTRQIKPSKCRRDDGDTMMSSNPSWHLLTLFSTFRPFGVLRFF